MLWYYTLTRTKNKMKIFDAELMNGGRLQKNILPRSWKRMAQHRVDKRNLRYKLEIYQNFFLDFVYGNPISRKTLSQDEEVEIGHSGIAQEEEMQMKEPQEFKGRRHEQREPQIAQDQPRTGGDYYKTRSRTIKNVVLGS